MEASDRNNDWRDGAIDASDFTAALLRIDVEREGARTGLERYLSLDLLSK
jgi:hypothetical protein